MNDEYDNEYADDHGDQYGSNGGAPPAGAIQRTGFSDVELATQGETAALAIAAASKAAIEARYVLAMRRTRSWDDVRVRLLKECERPGFAEAARYRKPVGNKFNEETRQWEQAYIEGLSIRFAEAAVRYCTNMYVDSVSIYDDSSKSIIRVTVMDLETNATIATDVTVTKTVERKKLKRNQRPLATRVNSYGDTVYILPATDDEVLNKTNALVSKALRNGILRLLPGDIADECESKCVSTVAAKIKADPDKARKDLLDAFAKIGIMPAELTAYVGHDLAALQPAEIVKLRAIYSAIKDGDTTWAEIAEAKKPEGDADAKPNGAARKVDELLEKHKKKAAEKKAPKPDKGATENQPAAAESERTREPGED